MARRNGTGTSRFAEEPHIGLGIQEAVELVG